MDDYRYVKQIVAKIWILKSYKSRLKNLKV